MDIQDYISSGVLELYVFDQLSKQERLEVESMCAQYPEVKTELLAIESTMEQTAFANKKELPTSFKESLFNVLNTIEKNPLDTTSSISTPLTETTSTPTLHVSKSTNYWLVAASVLALIGLFMSITFYSKYKNTNEELALIQHQQEQATQELAIYKNPDFRQINLARTDTLKEMKTANLFWNATSKEVYISWKNKAPLPSDKQYQLWAIVDGKPVDAGVFEITDSLQKMKLIANASAFAVTIENKGGSPTPTLSSMVVIGKI